MRHFIRKSAIPCSLLVVFLASMNASASEPGTEGEVSTYRVKYADIDLTRRQGAETLFGRIRSAARRVCEPVAVSAPFRFALASEVRCIDQAIAGAVAQVDSPLLTDLYLGKPSSTIKIAQN